MPTNAKGRRYAADTSVPAHQSRIEIEKLLERYGATAFGYFTEDRQQVIAFKIGGREVLMHLRLPDRDEQRFTHSPSGRGRRSPAAAQLAYEQGVRSAWRSLVLIIKAKLEAVESGITTIEREFLADIRLPSGTTVGQWLQPQIEQAYQSGAMPPMLPGGHGA